MEEYTIPNLVTFVQWNALKKYGSLTKGFSKFEEEDIDEICVFYDNDMNFIDYIERRKVENIIPSYVLLPRFFWEQHHETIPHDFIDGLEMPSRISELKHSYTDYWKSLQNNVVSDKHPLKCNIEPREEQVEVINLLLDTMQTKHKLQGVIQAPPGFGKTYLTIRTISNLRASAIIVVPNEVLADQWKDAILQFSNLEDSDIGMIQGSDLKKIDQEVDKPVCIVKIQSLYSQIKRNKVHELQSLYRFKDLVIYDECHNSGAATSYAKTSSIFMTPNIIGLSATPYRTGLNDYMLKTAIGETIYVANHTNLNPDIEIHNVYTKFNEHEVNRLRTLGQDYILFLGMFGSMMKTKQPYFDYMADVVNWNYSLGHNIVVLFPTIALMEQLQEAINTRHPELLEKVLLLKGKTKQDSMEMVKVERKILMDDYKRFKDTQDRRVKTKEIKRKDANLLIKEKRSGIDSRIEYLKEHALDLYKQKVVDSEIIISNYNLLSAGFDKSQLSNIIFGGPPRVGKISVIQSIGRITRKHEGKLNPLVQYFIPSPFLDFQKSTGIILQKNIKVQYEKANFKYFGFKREE